MPIYEYKCTKCKTVVELLVKKAGGKGPDKCEKCGGPMKKLLSAPAIQFKGSGWYVTDYAGKNAGNHLSKSKEAAETKPAKPAETPAKPKDGGSGTGSGKASSGD